MTYPFARAVGVTAVAGLICLWKLGILALIAWGLRRWESRPFEPSTLGWSRGDLRHDVWPRAVLGLLGCGILAVVIGAAIHYLSNAAFFLTTYV